MKDSFCKPLFHNGKTIYGGAARNVRIKRAGGLENMINKACRNACLDLLEQIEAITQPTATVIPFQASKAA